MHAKTRAFKRHLIAAALEHATELEALNDRVADSAAVGHLQGALRQLELLGEQHSPQSKDISGRIAYLSRPW